MRTNYISVNTDMTKSPNPQTKVPLINSDIYSTPTDILKSCIAKLKRRSWSALSWSIPSAISESSNSLAFSCLSYLLRIQFARRDIRFSWKTTPILDQTPRTTTRHPERENHSVCSQAILLKYKPNAKQTNAKGYYIFFVLSLITGKYTSQ